MKFKVHVEENLVAETEDDGLAAAILHDLIINESRDYRVSHDNAALVVKKGLVYIRDRLNPDELREIGYELERPAAWFIIELLGY